MSHNATAWGFTSDPDDMWRDRAACRNSVDPELFFPIGMNAASCAQTAEAKAVCKRCPVKAECLKWALANGCDGIWGGKTESERIRIRRGIPEKADTERCPNNHPRNEENLRYDRRGAPYCVECRQACGRQAHRKMDARKTVAEQFPPIQELARELELSVPEMRWCQGCRARYRPTMPRQKLCRTCGTKHPDRSIRRRYAAVSHA